MYGAKLSGLFFRFVGQIGGTALCGLLTPMLGFQPAVGHATVNQPSESTATSAMVRFVEQMRPHPRFQDPRFQGPTLQHRSATAENRGPTAGSSAELRIVGRTSSTLSKPSAAPAQLMVAPTEQPAAKLSAKSIANSNLQTTKQQTAEFSLKPFGALKTDLPIGTETLLPFLQILPSPISTYLTLYADEGGLDGASRPGQDESSGNLTERISDREGRLGQAPPERSLQFLRRQAVLLPSGQYQFDIGMNYTLFESEFTDVLPGNVLAETRVRQRILTVPLAVRYGLTDRTQLSLYVPFGWVNNEISRLGYDRFDNSGGIGDVRFALSRLLRRSSGHSNDPDIIATFATTAPTGDSDVLQALLGTPVDQLGGGFWAASWNLLFIHNYDPIIVFYSFGSRHRFSRSLDGIYVVPGDEYIYQLGVGFAVNSSVTLSTSFLGEYITEPKLDGVRQAGLIREPMRMRFAATIANPHRSNLVEPFAEIGMTENAPSARFGITWTY